MFTIIRNHVTGEAKRFAKYAVVGTALGGGAGGAVGYYAIEMLLQESEENLMATMKASTPEFLQPLTKFVISRLIAKVKMEGLEGGVFYGATSGLFTGASLGFTRVSITALLFLSRSAVQIARKFKK